MPSVQLERLRATEPPDLDTPCSLPCLQSDRRDGPPSREVIQ